MKSGNYTRIGTETVCRN